MQSGQEIKVATIKYVSVNPGIGKTHWAINLLSNRIIKKEGVTFFVAPTIALLLEVYELIKKELHKSLHKHIHLIEGESGNSLTSEQIRILVSGGSTNDRGGKSKPQPLGTVILCSHRAFSLLPHYDTEHGTPAFVDRAKISVIYDEARKCVVSEHKINLPENIAKVLLTKYFKIENLFEAAGYKSADVAEVYNKEFDLLFADNKNTRIARDVVKGIFNTTANKATKLYLAVNVNTANTSIDLQTISVPHLLFSGWKEVILLSAFFETSQMYHLLKSKEFDINLLEKQVRETKTAYTNRKYLLSLEKNLFTLQDITKEVTTPSRINLINNRYKKTSITYISSNVSLSKNHLTKGVMMDSNVSKLWDSKAYIEKYNYIAAKQVITEGVTKPYLRNVLITQRRIENSKYLYTPSDYDIMIVNHFKTLPGLVTKYTPLQWYAKAAVFISDKWYKEKGLPVQPVPITCNAGNGEFAKQIARKLNENTYVSMPFNSQGINTYKKYDTIAFLATLNPTPETKRFLLALCPTYDSDLDCTLDQCVQSLARCSVRESNSKSEPLFIVTDKILAEKVIKHLGGFPKLINPSYFKLPLKDPFSISFDSNAKTRVSAHQKTDVAKSKAKAKRLFLMGHSKYYANIKSLESSIFGFKKTNSKKLEPAKAELANLKVLYAKESIVLLRNFALNYFNNKPIF